MDLQRFRPVNSSNLPKSGGMAPVSPLSAENKMWKQRKKILVGCNIALEYETYYMRFSTYKGTDTPNSLYAVRGSSMDLPRYRFSKFVNWPNSFGMLPVSLFLTENKHKRLFAETKETNISRLQYSIGIRNILYNVRGRSMDLPRNSRFTLPSSLHVTPYQSHASVQLLSDHPVWLLHEVPTVAS